MSLVLTSPAFAHGQRIPRKYSGEGEDISPPLVWTGVPEGAKELALICEDPDAPTAEPWVHWVIYKISADQAGLPENVAKTLRPKSPAGALQGKNSWTSGQTVGYRGPMPPTNHGEHRYFFRLYALRAKLTAESGMTRNTLATEMVGNVLDECELMGTYLR